MNRGYSLRQAQREILNVILSSSFPVILSSSKDDTPRRLKVGDPVPLRQAQSDSMAQSESEAQSDTRPVTLRQAQSDIQPVILSSSKDDPIEGLKY